MTMMRTRALCCCGRNAAGLLVLLLVVALVAALLATTPCSALAVATPPSRAAAATRPVPAHVQWAAKLREMQVDEEFVLKTTRVPKPRKPFSSRTHVGEPARCQWCHGRGDGLYADLHATHHPCSHYFRCKEQQLLSLHACPEGLFFSAALNRCTTWEASTCGDASQGHASSYHRSLQKVAPNKPRRNFTAGELTDMNALLAFKANVFDIAQIMPTSWVPENPLSKWWGITVSPKTGRVTQVVGSAADEDGNYMVLTANSGAPQSIPPDFGNMTELDNLDLSSVGGYVIAGLRGSIPQEITRLKKLTRLSVATNFIAGSIPSFLTELKNLQSLDLSDNQFRGALPPFLGSMVSLTELVLDYGAFNGSIPVELSNLTALATLSLDVCFLTGSIPDSFSTLSSLATLSISSNALQGPLPTWLFSVPTLASIDLSFNQLTGPFPDKVLEGSPLFELIIGGNQFGKIDWDWLGKICLNAAGFMTLDIQRSQLTGPLPTQLASCSLLASLDLSENSFSGPIPPVVLTPGLQFVNLHVNQLSGTIPAKLANMNCVAQISLYSNQLSGNIPPLNCKPCAAIGQNLLTAVMLSDNQLSGPVPPALNTNCLGMSVFNVSMNKLSGSIPSSYLKIPTWTYLLLDNNNFTGPLPVPQTCDKIMGLQLHNNSFTGPLPLWRLQNCVSLVSFDISHNQLSGQLPNNIQKLAGGDAIIKFNASFNEFSGPIPANISKFNFLKALDLSHNQFSGSLPAEVGTMQRLQALDVGSNELSGALSPSLGGLRSIQHIDLSNNQFSGDLPLELATADTLRYLRYFDISNNSLQGGIPFGFASARPDAVLNFASNNFSGQVPGGQVANQPKESLEGNENLCGIDGYPACPTQSSNDLSTGAIVAICVGAVVGIILMVLLIICLLRNKRLWTGGTMLVFEKLDYRLTITHILDATENFSDKYKLGRGGFGTVYRAMLQDGRTVAIKRLAQQSQQGEKEFEAEMNLLGNIKHRNLVSLVAAYIAPPPSNERLLIYNFLSGGSMDGLLAKDLPKDSPFRQWETRLSVALDTARGMKYLHHDCNPRIIHRDMKPANVLLDDNFNAYVADFGLAREVDMTKSHMSTAVFGTIGYLAPEYTQRGRLTFKSDVFAYGVLLLQLITGKQPTDEEVAERGLARWVGANSAASIVDSTMDIGDDMDQVLGAIKLGLLCTARVASDRPSMAEAVHLLENLGDFAKGINPAREKDVD